jgi:hypothetical protein
LRGISVGGVLRDPEVAAYVSYFPQNSLWSSRVPGVGVGRGSVV